MFQVLAVVALGCGHHGLAWAPQQRLSRLPSLLEAQRCPEESERRRFLVGLPKSIVAASCFLTQGIQPSWADDVTLDPPLAVVAGDAKKVSCDMRILVN